MKISWEEEGRQGESHPPPTLGEDKLGGGGKESPTLLLLYVKISWEEEGRQGESHPPPTLGEDKLGGGGKARRVPPSSYST